MKKVNYLVVVAVVALGLNVSSCKKDNTTDGVFTDSKVSAFQDDAQVNDMLDDVDNETDDVANGNSGLKSSGDTTKVTGRVVVWTNSGDTAKLATITYTDFQNPKANNERIKNGVIYVIVTGKKSENTYKRVVTFGDNFTVNGNKISGTKTIVKTSDDVYTITMTNGKITFPDNTFITCNFIRIRTQVEGQSTPFYIWDDAYTFEGSATGTNRKGENYTKTIVTPVKVLTTYRFPVSGSFTIMISETVISLDYGDGTMDNLATLSKDGKTKVITLKK